MVADYVENPRGKLVIFDRPGEKNRAGERCDSDNRLIGPTGAALARMQRAKCGDVSPKGMSEHPANFSGLARDLAGKRRQRTTGAGGIEVLTIQISIHPRDQRVAAGIDCRSDKTGGVGSAVGQRLGQQCVLITEMGIEASGGEPGGAHDRIDAALRVTLFAKEAGSLRNDPVVSLLLVLYGITHNCRVRLGMLAFARLPAIV